jgi:hypothetical protein
MACSIDGKPFPHSAFIRVPSGAIAPLKAAVLRLMAVWS